MVVGGCKISCASLHPASVAAIYQAEGKVTRVTFAAGLFDFFGGGFIFLHQGGVKMSLGDRPEGFTHDHPQKKWALNSLDHFCCDIFLLR